MYRITYTKGEILVNVSTTMTGYKAHLTDARNNTDALIAGESEDDIYDKCRCWASSNIFGEFIFEHVANASEFKSGVAA